MTLQVRRLSSQDLDVAQRVFALMATVFEEERAPLSASYVRALLERADFWALAAFTNAGELVGGLRRGVD